MIRNGVRLVAIAALVPFSQATDAHHSSSPHYDPDTPISLIGDVVEFRFVNPHAFLYFDVTDQDGNVSRWNCELRAASTMRRLGWTKDVFEPGTTIQIQGIAARRDPHGCALQSAVLEDGTRVQRNQPFEERAQADSDPVVGDSIAGNWAPVPRQRRPGRDRGNSGPPRGAALFTDEHRAALEIYDQRFDDPALECSPSSILRVWGEPGVVNTIEFSGDAVVIRHEFMDTVRTVYLDGRDPPDDFEPDLTGWSVGYFDGDELVINTSGFEAGVLMPHPGMLHSDEMKVVERLGLNEDGSQLTRSYEVIDPRYFSEPYTAEQRWQRTNLSLSNYGCIELSGISKDREAFN